MIGKLYLIPTTLGETEPLDVMPISVKRVIEEIDYYIVENEKSARKFIKHICPEKKTIFFTHSIVRQICARI